MHAGLVTNLVEAPAQLAVLAASGALAQPPSHEAQCRTFVAANTVATGAPPSG